MVCHLVISTYSGYLREHQVSLLLTILPEPTVKVRSRKTA